MDHGVSSRLALSAPFNPESESPRVKRAKTDPPYGAFAVGHPHRTQISQFELSSSNFSIRAFRAYPLIEIRQTVPCRAIRGKSSDSRQQYLSQQHPPPLLRVARSSSQGVLRALPLRFKIVV